MDAQHREGATEPPSQRKLRRARERGEGPVSRQALAAAAALGGLVGLTFALPDMLAGLRALLGCALSCGHALAWREALLVVGRGTAAVGLGAALAAGLAGGLQAGLRFRLRWEPGRLSPFKGLGRLFGRERLAEVAWTLARAAALFLVGWLALDRALGEGLAAGARGGPGGAARAALALLVCGAAALALAQLLLALLDLGLERLRFLRRQRMTRQEQREEHRQDEGDPGVRAERRRRHRQAAQGPGLGAASVLVVNPTHAAAALRYTPGEDLAPVLVAAGVGEAARRLRAEAARLGLPIVRHVALARALQRLEPGELVPERLYAAAAEVLRVVAAVLGPNAGAGRAPREEERR
jgi:flagellar biosynthesis protein FlhB